MKKYLVVSYDPDEQQWFYDTVLALDAGAASAFVWKVRPYVIAADAALGENFGAKVTVEVHETSWDASEPLSQCDNCQDIFPESELKPVEDLSERVAPGEPMPSGECPTCGAVCHLLEVGT